MSSDVLIQVEDLSKKFCRNFSRSLWYGVQDIMSEMSGGNGKHSLRREEFWAVNNVSFELKRGECLGLIGPNGSGKSTLLKMLNGLLKPDSGRIEICGRVGGLIELGVGFNPVLTGRENIYNNGAVLGLTKEFIDKKFDEIVEFSEIDDFIDMPVQNYSSGMKVRLGFAVAAQMDPDVLIIDEVLAVGDVGFRAKCYEVIGRLLKNCAVILVSHSMSHISRNSTSILTMDNGLASRFNNIGEGIERYLDLCCGQNNLMTHSNDKVNVEELSIRGKNEDRVVKFGSPYEITLKLTSESDIHELVIYLNILSREQTPVAFTTSGRFKINRNKRIQEIIFSSEHMTLSPGKYTLAIVIYDKDERSQLLWHQGVCAFNVEGRAYYRAPVTLVGDWSELE